MSHNENMAVNDHNNASIKLQEPRKCHVKLIYWPLIIK